MSPKTILRRWAALERGDGVVRARWVKRGCIIAALVLFEAGWLAGTYWKSPAYVPLMIGVIAGWLIAESNALDYRMRAWPIIRRYIDWERVHQDIETEDPT